MTTKKVLVGMALAFVFRGGASEALSREIPIKATYSGTAISTQGDSNHDGIKAGLGTTACKSNLGRCTAQGVGELVQLHLLVGRKQFRRVHFQQDPHVSRDITGHRLARRSGRRQGNRHGLRLGRFLRRTTGDSQLGGLLRADASELGQALDNELRDADR